MVTHLGANWAKHRVTMLIKSNMFYTKLATIVVLLAV